MKVICLDFQCFHNKPNGNCTRSYIELDVMGMCNNFLVKQPAGCGWQYAGKDQYSMDNKKVDK